VRALALSNQQIRGEIMARVVRFDQYGDPSVLKIEGCNDAESGQKTSTLENGADHVVVTDEEDLVARVMEITDGAGARVVFDPVGGPSMTQLTESMARGAILLEYGALSTEPTPFPLFTVLGKSLTLKGYLYGEVTGRDDVLERAKTFIIKGLASGLLKPIIARTFRLEQIQEAMRFLESNAQIGKVVVNV
jgi:NADPH:quinone reductase-like Zn-dependent oxidoreductase